jgi:hypothetical protein
MDDYLHWQRFDWSFDSICPVCLATIAHADDEAGLAEQERNHVCDPLVLKTGRGRLNLGTDASKELRH